MSGDTTEDALLGGRVALRQPKHGFRAALDPVFLAALVPARAGERVLELGCGTGAAFLCLAARVPGVAVVAVERDAALAALAHHNAAANGCAAAVLCGDIAAAPAGPFHHALANPPWWQAGTPSPDPLRRAAGFEGEDAPLEAWVREMARRLRHRGTLSLVLPAARWAGAAAAMQAAGVGEVALLPLRPRAGEPAKIVLLQGRRDGRGPDRVLAGLPVHEAGGGYTAAATAVLRDAAPLTPPSAARPRAGTAPPPPSGGP